jgi:hypothetical protein
MPNRSLAASAARILKPDNGLSSVSESSIKASIGLDRQAAARHPPFGEVNNHK